jgi:hypothetical protein
MHVNCTSKGVMKTLGVHYILGARYLSKIRYIILSHEKLNTYIVKFSSKRGNSVFLCVLVLGFVTVVNFSSGSR